MTDAIAGQLLNWVAAHWLLLQLGIYAAFAFCAARAAVTCANGGR